jgi:hypothetical protein
MAEEEAGRAIDVNYLKPHYFRESACDGILGGPTPQGKLWIGFYTERLPLPRIIRHKIVETEKGQFRIDGHDQGLPIESRSGIIRNMEFGAFLSVETAKQLHTWLGDQISAITKSDGL